MKCKDILEEELKTRVGTEWLAHFDTATITGKIDFSVYPRPRKGQREAARRPRLWAEAKAGRADLAATFVQLVLTIGRARTFDKILPPPYLGAFDAGRTAFVPYPAVADIFQMADFNWHVPPSNHDTREFNLVRARIEQSLHENSLIFNYEKDAGALRTFRGRRIRCRICFS